MDSIAERAQAPVPAYAIVKPVASAIAKLVVAGGYSITSAYANAFLLQELVDYVNNDKELDPKTQDLLYWFGFGSSLATGLVYSLAVFYYKNKMQKEDACANDVEGGETSINSHGHSHHGHHHNLFHLLEHILGLWTFTTSLAIGGIYYAYLGEESPTNTKEMVIAGTLMALGGFFYSYGETAIHENFLRHAQNEEGNLLRSFSKLMFTEIYHQRGILAKLKKLYLHWGSFVSHISSAVFGISAAVHAIELFFTIKIPTYISYPIIFSLSCVGAVVHNNSELRAYAENTADVTPLFKYLVWYQKLFLGFTLMFLIFHIVPEAIGLPELFTPDSLSMIGRIGIVLAFMVVLGIPDLLVNVALMKKPLEGLFDLDTIERRPITERRASTDTTGSGDSGLRLHLASQDTVPTPPGLIGRLSSALRGKCPH